LPQQFPHVFDLPVAQGVLHGHLQAISQKARFPLQGGAQIVVFGTQVNDPVGAEYGDAQSEQGQAEFGDDTQG